MKREVFVFTDVILFQKGLCWIVKLSERAKFMLDQFTNSINRLVTLNF